MILSLSTKMVVAFMKILMVLSDSAYRIRELVFQIFLLGALKLFGTHE